MHDPVIGSIAVQHFCTIGKETGSRETVIFQYDTRFHVLEEPIERSADRELGTEVFGSKKCFDFTRPIHLGHNFPDVGTQKGILRPVSARTICRQEQSAWAEFTQDLKDCFRHAGSIVHQEQNRYIKTAGAHVQVYCLPISGFE